jgi:hypothetical protein
MQGTQSYRKHRETQKHPGCTEGNILIVSHPQSTVHTSDTKQAELLYTDLSSKVD